MASQIDPTTIDVSFPIAGQDNDTRGFHDNYRAIQNGLVFARAEISDLQPNSLPVLGPYYTGNFAAGNITVSGNITAANLIVTSVSYINQEYITTTDFIAGNAAISGNLVANSGALSNSSTSGALVVTGGTGISGNLNVGGNVVIASVGDVSANIGRLFLGNASTNANLGAYQTWANTTNNTIQANLGAYQTLANANAATQQTQINSLVTTANANVAAYLITATGNISANTLTMSSVVQFANLTTAQINAISPANRGMTAFNYTTGNIQVYNGTKWANITLS